MRLKALPEEDPKAIQDPSTGEWIALNDVDGLIGFYERMDLYYHRSQALRREIAQALLELTTGDTKTRRLRGQNKQVKIELPSDSWEQGKLMEAWNSYPKYRDELLRVTGFRVLLTAYNKAVNTTGTPDFMQFVKMVTEANRGPVGSPRIVVEE